MRITAVQSFSISSTGQRFGNDKHNVQCTTSHPADNRELSSYSYGRDLISRKNPSFTAGEISKAGQLLANQIPVEEKLAAIFQVLKQGDILLLGGNFNKAQIALKKHLSKLKQIIKKEYFIKEDKLNHNYAFLKNNLDEIEILNINDKKLNYITGGKKYYLDPGTSYYVINHDTVQYADDVIHLKEKPKTDISKYIPVFSHLYDHSEKVQSELAKLNSKTISSMIVSTKGASNRVGFGDIGGQDKAIAELKNSILFPVKYPEAYTGDDITRGFILYGPAGTGKTELCRALANEAGMNSSYISGTSFQSKWVGESEANVRAWFEELKENQPSIGVIDELDAITSQRTGQDVYGDKLVDQILTSMTDIYNENDDVFILGLTNNFDKVDNAIKRAERFSKHILIDAPDRDGVKAIFDIHTRNRRLDENIDKEALIDKMYSLKVVGSDIKFITKLAKEQMMNRLGIYEKMENGTFLPSDMDGAIITHGDFVNAINDFAKQHKTSSRKPIGFMNK